MAKQLTEEELNLRRKLRRRLIGAAALTLTVVVVLPMVLDREPKSTGQDIELRIPDPDKVGDLIAAKAPEDDGSAASDVAAASSVAQTISEVAAVPSAAKSLPIIHAAPPTPPESATDNKVDKTQQSVSTPVPAHEVAQDNHSETGFVAQVGAYSNADTAKQEYAQLKSWGFKAYTERIGDKVRVRVGPYAERDKAEKVQRLLEKHGLHPVVTSAK